MRVYDNDDKKFIEVNPTPDVHGIQFEIKDHKDNLLGSIIIDYFDGVTKVLVFHAYDEDNPAANIKLGGKK